jgi:hypothetical protein
MAYLLDANVFIQAKNLHYGLDFCPAFWDWLVQQGTQRNLCTIDKVEAEILAGVDTLSEWIQLNGQKLVKAFDQSAFQELGSISNWVISRNYDPAAQSQFFQVADFYLIAYAKAYGLTVVTHETPSNSIKKIKIPDVCSGLNIPFMTPYEMLRRAGARFVLGGGIIP